MYDLINILKEATDDTGKSSVKIVATDGLSKLFCGDSHFTITPSKGSELFEIADLQQMFHTFDKLLTQGGVYSVTVYPEVSLVITNNGDVYTIKCNTIIHDDLIEQKELCSCQHTSVIVPVSKVIHNVAKRSSMPLLVTIEYTTSAAIHETTHVVSESPKIIVSEVEPGSSRINIPPVKNVLFADESDVKSKGYTNVTVGHEDDVDPGKHLKRIIAEVQQHMENVKNNNTRVTEANQTLEDLHITNNAVSPEDVEAHRRKVFEEGRLALAKEAKRKEEQSTEDDFAV